MSYVYILEIYAKVPHLRGQKCPPIVGWHFGAVEQFWLDVFPYSTPVGRNRN